MLNCISSEIRRKKIVFSVLVPFAVGYHLTYFYRTINALLANDLSTDLALTAAELGTLTSTYFLAAALAQLPLGMALDRFGPRRVQTATLVIAATGACLFAVTTSFYLLCISRALIGFGIASALMAGLKAIVLWAPKERVPFFNGIFIAIGAAGALTAAAPAEWALYTLTWRHLFVGLAIATISTSALVYFVTPECRPATARHPARGGTFAEIYSNPHFWRLAPLSALLIGTAWAHQGLWAAPWLKEVAGYDRTQVVLHLNVMACALCVGALGFGLLVDRLRKRGITTHKLLATVASIFIIAQIALALRLPMPPMILWSVIASVGAATVLSYSIMAELFSKDVAGRANSALNLFHFGAAFAIQSGCGAIIGYWARDTSGSYPPDAFSSALLVIVILQIVALLWFLLPLRQPGGIRNTEI